MQEQRRFQVQDAEKPGFDRFFEERICQPLAARIPRRLRPNTISVVNHLVMWGTAILLGSAAWFQGVGALLLLYLGSMGFVLSAILDSLDGMHARATGQCSKLGELLDHGLDAPNILLNAVGVVLALQLESYVAVAGLLSTAFAYHAQVVLHHHAGEWVPPPASAPAGQMACALSVWVWGTVFLVFGRSDPTVALWVDVFGWAVTVVNCRQWFFYLVRLKGRAIHHLNLIVISSVYAGFYLSGFINLLALIVLLVGVNYRLTGTYVLYTLQGRRYHGWDPSTLGWLVLIAAQNFVEPIQFGGITLQTLSPYLATVHVVALNLLDIRRTVREYDWASPEPTSPEASDRS